MRADLAMHLRGPLKALVTAAFLGLALGYATFYFVFPNVSVPASGEASLILILGILALAGLIGGLVTEDLPSSVIQGFLSIPIGASIAFLLAISPIVTGSLEVRSDDIFSFVVRLGLPLYLLAVPLYNISGLLGFLMRERFRLRSVSFLRPRGIGQRK